MLKKKSFIFFFTLIFCTSIMIVNIQITQTFYSNSTFLLTSLTSQITWDLNGTIICNASGGQGASTTLIDENGYIWINWWDLRKDGGDIYIQKLDGTGQEIFQTNGILVFNDSNTSEEPKMVLDGGGGVIITWQDNRTGQNEIYMQRINSQGEKLWSTNGKKVVSTSSLQEDPQLVNTSDGNFIIVWEDNRSALTGIDIYAQKINLNGDRLWGEAGKVVCNATSDQLFYSQLYQSLQATEQGGLVVAWRDQRVDAGDIYIQQLDQDGNPQWHPNGTAICNLIERQRMVIVKTIDDDNIFIIWRDERNSATLDRDLYAQKINSLGIIQWTVNGTLITNALNFQGDHDLITPSVDNIFVVWYDERVDSVGDIYMQKLNESGITQWDDNGSLVSNNIGEEKDPKIIKSGEKLFITWIDKSGTPARISIIEYGLNGDKSWSSVLNVSNAPGSRELYNFIVDGTGGMILAWWDNRADSNGDLYMLRLNSSGGIWVPTDDGGNDPPPPDLRWIIVFIITLSIAIPAAGAAVAAVVNVKKRRAPPEGQPKKLLTQKKLPEDQEKLLKMVGVFLAVMIRFKKQ